MLALLKNKMPITYSHLFLSEDHQLFLLAAYIQNLIYLLSLIHQIIYFAALQPDTKYINYIKILIFIIWNIRNDHKVVEYSSMVEHMLISVHKALNSIPSMLPQLNKIFKKRTFSSTGLRKLYSHHTWLNVIQSTSLIEGRELGTKICIGLIRSLREAPKLESSRTMVSIIRGPSFLAKTLRSKEAGRKDRRKW